MKLNTSKGRTRVGLILACLVLFLIAFAVDVYFRIGRTLLRPHDPAFQLTSPLDLAALPTAARFDFPIGSEHGALTYNAQPFTQDRHLGDDLNGIGGENSDMNDPVFAVADGRVLFAAEAGPGWGNVVIVLHAYDENGARRFVQSFYAHLEKILVRPKQDVRRGEQIATIGNANGRYWAHLHFEMREFITPFIGPGYREDTRGWINPSEFIRQHRGAPDDDVGRSEVPQQVNPVQQNGTGN
ncbi:MAG: M23 family metallopeptidase [Chthoniobacterales bacterium]